MPQTEAQILQQQETARLKKKYTCTTTKLEDSFVDSNIIILDDYNEKLDPLHCVMLRMKYEALSGTKQVNSGQGNEKLPLCDRSPDVGNSSFKIMCARSCESLKLAADKSNNIDTAISPKKKTKIKMSRLSLKRMLNSGPDVGQSNLNRFLDLQTNRTAINNTTTLALDRPQKSKKSNKHFIENNEKIDYIDTKEQDKVVYKISTAIFGNKKSNSKNDYSDKKHKKKVRKKNVTQEAIKNPSEVSSTNLIKLTKNDLDDEPTKKIELINEVDDKLIEHLQQDLEIEVKHFGIQDTSVENISQKSMNKCEGFSNSAHSIFSHYSIALTSENNVELELIADKCKMRKCKSLELVKKSPITPRNIRFSNEARSFSLDKRFKHEPSYKTLPGYSVNESAEIASVESSKLGNKNAFQFLMDMRNNVIGQNSPGKHKDLEDNLEEKVDLTHRKNMLQQWANKKITASKRKLQDEERGEYIEFALDKRAKRLKKLLNCDKFESSVIELSDEEIVEKTHQNETKTSKYMEEMSKSINYIMKKANYSQTDVNMDNILMSATKEEVVAFQNKETKKGKLATLQIDTTEISAPNLENKTSKFEEHSEESPKDTPIIVDNDSITSIKSFPILETAKSSPRKPLQQTLLFCTSNVNNSLKNKGTESENIVLVKTSSSLKKKNEGKLSLKSNKEIQNSVKIQEGLTKKYLKKEVNQKIESKDNLNRKSAKKNCMVTKNGIIDLVDSSVDSTNTKSISHIDKNNVKSLTDVTCTQINKNNLKDSMIKEISTKLCKESSKYDTTDVPISNLTNFRIETDENNTKSSNLRRSSRIRKQQVKQYQNHVDETPEIEIKCKKSKSKIQYQKDAKIATVFLKAVPKPKIDSAIIEARRNFLYSASPIKMKETATMIENSKYEPFPAFCHTLQKTESIFWNLPSINLGKLIRSADNNIPLDLNYEKPYYLGSFTTCQVQNPNAINLRKLTEIQNKKSILLNIKRRNPDYPVYKSFKLLKLKNKHAKFKLHCDLNKTVPTKLVDDSCLIMETDSEDCEYFDSATLWTDKYKPTCSEDIIGNRSAAVELLKFLKRRLLYCNESNKQNKHKNSQQVESDDDFVSSDDDNSNVKHLRLGGNTMLLRGPHGSGKTSSVYAVCQELDINVLELNASSKRTGRILTQKLQEATQSQQIHKQHSGLQNCEKSLSKMCLVLVEDIDVVFDQDDGFINALSQLLQTSKRPIVLTFTDDTNPNVQKFVQQYPVITFSQLSAKTCSVWLQLACLLENLLLDEESIGELLEWNKGDIRRTLLQLQFWGLSGGDSVTKQVDPNAKRLKMLRQLSADDTINILDDSNTSELNESVLNADVFTHRKVVNSFYIYKPRLSLGQNWWNFSNIIEKYPTRNYNSLGSADESEDLRSILLTDEMGDILKTLPTTKQMLKSIQTYYESLSIADCLYDKMNDYNDDLEPTYTTFQTNLKASLSLEHFEDCYTCEKDELKGMIAYLIDHSLKQNIDYNIGSSFQFNMGVPVAANRRWRFKQHGIQETFSDKLPLNIALHRKHFSLDYFPMLISIVKLEQTQLKMSTKRRNRFYSYLRNFDIKFTQTQLNCLNSAFDV